MPDMTSLPRMKGQHPKSCPKEKKEEGGRGRGRGEREREIM